MTHDERNIRELLANYEKLLNASDAAAIAGLYAANGIFMPHRASPPRLGAKRCCSRTAPSSQNITLSIAFAVDEIMVREGLATALTRSNGSVRVNATGDAVLESNRELFVFSQEAGAWRIARYMFNKAA